MNVLNASPTSSVLFQLNKWLNVYWIQLWFMDGKSQHFIKIVAIGSWWIEVAERILPRQAAWCGLIKNWMENSPSVLL